MSAAAAPDRGLRRFFSRFFTSGRDSTSLDELIRYVLLNIALLVGGMLLVVFGFSVFLEGNSPRAVSDWAMSVLCFVTLVLLRTKIHLRIPGGVALAAYGILCGIFVHTGELHGFASLWIFSFPLLTIFVLGLQIGLIFSMLLLCSILASTIIPGLADLTYNGDIASRLIGVYVLVTLLTVVYEQTRIIKDRRVDRLTNELKVERDVVAAMKDNLKTGLFLMNRDFEIQGSYSKPLETILGTDEIEGKKLTAFLAASLKAKERDTLEDYFGMVLNRQFDTAMLEDINPISEFTYADEINKTEKILRTAFTPVDLGMNDYYVMGSFEDVSAARELERQLEQESQRLEEEMRTFFQVIQVDPGVFADFIEDTDYEFERINSLLKDKELSARDALTGIYQSVHAVKSNSLILGLENFSGKLHALEDEIKKLSDREDIPFEDVLHITIELEYIMKEKDKFQDTIKKLESFRKSSGGSRKQNEVLLGTLTKVCDKASLDLGKKVKLTPLNIDAQVMEDGPRRIIKEVLTQLVRNSVYHGIEEPGEREAAGKTAEGTIQLSINREKGMIHVKLGDDGRGLNFAKIREKAVKLGLIREEDVEDKNALLKVIFSPGFSTAETADLHAGRGIGLNLVRERIRDLKGSIKLSSEPGMGTVFNIFIPEKSA